MFHFTHPDPNGRRDNDKHKRILSNLLDVMLENVECFFGFASLVRPIERDRAHKEYLEECIVNAIAHATMEAFAYYRQPINLVFAKQRHYSESKIEQAIRSHKPDDETNRRIKTHSFASPDDVCALQAADILAYEMARDQRGRRTRYPFQRMMDAAREEKIILTLKWGPIRRRHVLAPEF